MVGKRNHFTKAVPYFTTNQNLKHVYSCDTYLNFNLITGKNGFREVAFPLKKMVMSQIGFCKSSSSFITPQWHRYNV